MTDFDALYVLLSNKPASRLDKAHMVLDLLHYRHIIHTTTNNAEMLSKIATKQIELAGVFTNTSPPPMDREPDSHLLKAVVDLLADIKVQRRAHSTCSKERVQAMLDVLSFFRGMEPERSMLRKILGA